MNDLLALTINAHGGIERWKQFKAVSAHLVTGGVLWNIKGKAGMLDDIHVTVDLHRQWVSHTPFGAPNQHTSMEAERVAIEATDGTVIEELQHPRSLQQVKIIRSKVLSFDDINLLKRQTIC
jgi:hypothetical protein